MEKTITINRLPVRTWNRLGVNETKLPWDAAALKDLGTETITAAQEPVRVPIRAEADSRKTVLIQAEEGQSVTVYETMEAAGRLEAETRLKVGKNGTVCLIQLHKTGPEGVLVSRVTADCGENAAVRLIQVVLGSGDVYTDTQVELLGDGGSLRADVGYLGQRQQALDMNLVVNHYGRGTTSEIDAAGALKDSARKIFRGTIDFKKGSADATGDEKETVLLLGDDVVNKTVPLILCAEETVAGNHGATIGQLDDETLFYFESRGISKETAENLMARAAIERLARLTGDPETEKLIFDGLDEELGENG